MLAFAHNALICIVTWLPMIALIITIHELGHFSVARACGVKIDRFSLGFGRALASWRDRHGTEWRIGWIPFGGYVKFAGDENAASVPDAENLSALRAAIIEAEGPGAERQYFVFKPLWQRALVVAAGPLANFVLSTLLFAIVLCVMGRAETPARVSAVVPASAAARAGFQVGDLVVDVDGRPIHDFDDLVSFVQLRAGLTAQFGVERGGRRLVLPTKLDERVVDDPVTGKQRIGSLGIAAQSKRSDYVRYGPIQAIGGGARESWDVVSTTIYYVGRMVSGQVSADQIGGPLRTLQLSGKVAKVAASDSTNPPTQVLLVLVSLTQLAAFISVSVGFLNLLPIPVLDGGHLVFYAYEAVARRPVGATVQNVSYRVGLALLLGLMLFATTNDLQRLHVFHFLGGLFS